MERTTSCPATGTPPEARIKRRAIELGFDLAGIAPARMSSDADHLLSWLEAGHHAGMSYMAREPERRMDPGRHLSGARAVVVVAVSCNVRPRHDSDSARFATYALNDDYHEWMRPRLADLGEFVAAVSGAPCRWKAFCDTTAVLERELAASAGLGWIGRNTMLVNRSLGSHLLLGGLIVDCALEHDSPVRSHCGSCRRCVEACPTGALVAPYVLDARCCISYHTIESRDPIPDAIAARMGNRVFGCDICQEVCPFNGVRAQTSRNAAFLPRPGLDLTLEQLLCMTAEEYGQLFANSAVRRAKLTGLRRNAEAALRHRKG